LSSLALAGLDLRSKRFRLIEPDRAQQQIVSHAQSRQRGVDLGEPGAFCGKYIAATTIAR
jgi:hypothetical protein